MQIKDKTFFRDEQGQRSSKLILFKRSLMETPCHMGGMYLPQPWTRMAVYRAWVELVSPNSRYIKYKCLCQRLVTPTLSLHFKERDQQLQLGVPLL